MALPFLASGGGGGASGGVSSLTGDSILYNNAASTGAVTLSPIAQPPNVVCAGPVSGGSVAPTFRALATADLPLANAVGAIAFEQAASASSATSAQSYTQAVTILKGDCVTVFVNSGNAMTWDPIIRDNAGNSYSLALTSITTGGIGITYVFVCLNANNAASKISVSFSGVTAGLFIISVGTYAGVKSIGAINSTTIAASTAGTISLTPTFANSYMVAGFCWYDAGVAVSVVSNTGTIRTNTPSTTTTLVGGTCLVDNTQAGLGSETCAVTANVAPTHWNIVAIELIHN